GRMECRPGRILRVVVSQREMVVARGGVEPPTFRFSVGRSYQLSYLASAYAVLTGLEPATSALTGRRALRLLHRTLLWCRAPNGIRTRATALKGRRPRPLDDGGGSVIIPHRGRLTVALPSGPAGGQQSIRDGRTAYQPRYPSVKIVT